MYNDFYGFQESPFNITPDPRFLFLSESHREALNHLHYGVQERKGFIQLTGEVGCGKTTLCRKFFEQLDSRYITGLIFNPMLSESQLLGAILNDFGIKAKNKPRLSNYEQLNQFLLEQTEQGKLAVAVIDEAQNLSSSILESLRLLSNLETDDCKLLQIILIGQPELCQTINSRNLRQLRQRITVRYHLGPLNLEDTERYLQHRISIAGGQGSPFFDRSAIKRIHNYSKGVPRLINALADKALLAGFIYKSNRIRKKMVKIAEKELEGNYK